jgi:hypothetical protein
MDTEYIEWLKQEIKSLREEGNEQAELDYPYARQCWELANEREHELSQHLRAARRGVDLLTIQLEDIHAGEYSEYSWEGY